MSEELKQKACESAVIDCGNRDCPACSNPAPFLNTWEEEIRKGDVWIDMENIEVIIEFIKKVETLAIQKERERIRHDIEQLYGNGGAQRDGNDEAIDNALAIVNKGVEEK